VSLVFITCLAAGNAGARPIEISLAESGISVDEQRQARVALDLFSAIMEEDSAKFDEIYQPYQGGPFSMRIDIRQVLTYYSKASLDIGDYCLFAATFSTSGMPAKRKWGIVQCRNIKPDTLGAVAGLCDIDFDYKNRVTSFLPGCPDFAGGKPMGFVNIFISSPF
jgi:hypothetical protein